MTKKQKIWLWISGAMFVVPEVLWSPIGNFYYELSQTSQSGGTHPFRYNFFQNPDNINYLKLVIFIQLISLLISLLITVKNKYSTNKIINYLSISFLVALLIIVGFSLYFVTTFSIDIF